MARRQSIGLRDRLTTLLPNSLIRDTARETGFVKRERKIDPVAFVWSLVLGFACGSERTIAGLRRAFESASGTEVVPSAFYDRFNAALVRCLRTLVGLAIERLTKTSGALGGALAGFKDLIVTDSSVVRLRDLLAKRFPGCRTNHTKAALKTHVVMGANRRSVTITSERHNDGKTFRIGQWVKGCLLLFDLGYFRYQLFDNIRRNLGSFISRLKKNANPKIVAVHRKWRGASVPLVGERLQDVLARLKREILDVEIEVDFRRRVYGGKRSGATATFRLIGVRDDETGEYHLYITNLPPDRYPPETVARLYRARWGIEMLFKSLKSDFHLEDMPSANPHVVEALVYATVLTWLASQELLAAVRRKLGRDARRATDRRWTRLLGGYALLLLRIVVGEPRDVRAIVRLVEPVIIHEAVDPHVHRATLIEIVANGGLPDHAASLVA